MSVSRLISWLRPLPRGAGVLLCGTLAMAGPGKVTARAEQAATDALFTNGVVLTLKIEISPVGMTSLRRSARTYVKGRVREGGTLYTNVMIRVKGGAGSFRSVDDKPGLTLKFDEAGASF